MPEENVREQLKIVTEWILQRKDDFTRVADFCVTLLEDKCRLEEYVSELTERLNYSTVVCEQQAKQLDCFKQQHDSLNDQTKNEYTINDSNNVELNLVSVENEKDSAPQSCDGAIMSIVVIKEEIDESSECFPNITVVPSLSELADQVSHVDHSYCVNDTSDAKDTLISMASCDLAICYVTEILNALTTIVNSQVQSSKHSASTVTYSSSLSTFTDNSSSCSSFTVESLSSGIFSRNSSSSEEQAIVSPNSSSVCIENPSLETEAADDDLMAHVMCKLCRRHFRVSVTNRRITKALTAGGLNRYLCKLCGVVEPEKRRGRPRTRPSRHLIGSNFQQQNSVNGRSSSSSPVSSNDTQASITPDANSTNSNSTLEYNLRTRKRRYADHFSADANFVYFDQRKNTTNYRRGFGRPRKRHNNNRKKSPSLDPRDVNEEKFKFRAKIDRRNQFFHDFSNGTPSHPLRSLKMEPLD